MYRWSIFSDTRVWSILAKGGKYLSRLHCCLNEICWLVSCLIPFFFISIIIIIIAYYSSVNRPTVFKILTSNSFSQEGNFGESGRLFAVVSALSWTDKRQETNYFKYIFIYIYKYTHVYLFDQFLTTTPHSEFALLFMHLQQWFLTSFFNVVLICSIALISICSAIFFFFLFSLSWLLWKQIYMCFNSDRNPMNSYCCAFSYSIWSLALSRSAHTFCCCLEMASTLNTYANVLVWSLFLLI